MTRTFVFEGNKNEVMIKMKFMNDKKDKDNDYELRQPILRLSETRYFKKNT